MRASPLAVALSLVSAAACAQPANNASESMESCFQSARAADAICSDPANDPVKRLDCLDKARAVQLDCLNKVLASPTTGSGSSETPPTAGSPDMPTATVPQPAANENQQPETPTAQVPPDRRPEAASPDRLPTGSVSPEPAGPDGHPRTPELQLGDQRNNITAGLQSVDRRGGPLHVAGERRTDFLGRSMSRTTRGSFGRYAGNVARIAHPPGSSRLPGR